MDFFGSHTTIINKAYLINNYNKHLKPTIGNYIN